MPDNLSLLAYAKINLALDITGSRPDGYHTIRTVMQSIDLADTVTVERNSTHDTNGIDISLEISGADELFDNDQNNTAYIAAKAFFEYAKIETASVEIEIKKRIPLRAGLGGGSADAAAVIIALDRLYHTGFETEQLYEIAEEVGKDVPFCLHGSTQLAEGLGAILTPLPAIEGLSFLLIKAADKPSTAEMYRRFDELDEVDHPDMDSIVNDICEGEQLRAAAAFDNVFSPLWDNFAKIKHALMHECGAVNAVLTGSGPTVFGIFADEDDASHAKSVLSDDYDDMFVCSPIDCGVEEK